MPHRLIDLFAGCGGLSAGFAATGRFESVLAVEIDAAAAETYETNFGHHVARLEDGTPSRIEEVVDIPPAEVVVGGPPCQGFSPLNMRQVGIERRGLWREYLRVLDASGAAVFVMENVPQLLSAAEFRHFVDALEQRVDGWRIRAEVLNAADFGVPQTRRRAIVVGSRRGEPPWPEQTHHSPDRLPLGGRPWRTFRDAVAGLPLQPDSVNWHDPRNPTAVSLERYRTVPVEGEGRFDLAARRPDITPACWLRKPSGSTDVFGRLWWDRPAFTIRTEFFKPEKGRYLHPSEHRPITLREGARCQSFEDDFVFPSHQSMTTVAKQIGNAVPPLLAGSIAAAIVSEVEAPAAGAAADLAA